MRIGLLVVTVGVLATSCGTPAIEVERADVAVGPAPTSPMPPADLDGVDASDPGASTTAPDDVDTTSTSPVDQPDDDPHDDPSGEAIETRPPSLGVGDELFPELGSADVDVLSYDVRLDVTADVVTVAGEVTITAQLAAGVATLPLDQVDLEVDSVEVDGEPATFRTTETELLVDVAPGEVGRRLVVDVGYRFARGGHDTGTGILLGWLGTPGEVGSYVLNEPDGARRWLPANDHPSDKASWTFEITVPPGTVGVANGDLLDRPPSGAAGTWAWSQREPMPTYLSQVIVGEYELVVPDPVVGSDGSAIPLLHVVPVGTRARFAEAFEGIDDQVAFFEERFGPYPLDRYGLAFVDGLADLAMETQGRSMFGAADFPTPELGLRQELLLAHELAHQWFGNAVSPADWSDLWLNESITTYAQWLWLDEIGLQPLDAHASAMLDRRQRDGESTGDPSVEALFGFLRYDGGAPILHALRATMGDEAFFDLLRRWVADNVGTSRTTEDFIALAEEVHGASLAAFFDDWLFAGDLPDEYPT